MRAQAVVLEARHKTGGAASTDAPAEFKVITYSYVMSLIPYRITKDLTLLNEELLTLLRHCRTFPVGLFP